MQEPEPPQPEPSVERAVRALVRLYRLFERADAGLSLAQFRIMELVSRGTERSTHIATRLATSKPAVTMVVDALVANGLLTRGSQHRDRRVVVLALTPQGEEALAKAERAYRDRLDPLLDEISDSRSLLLQLTEIDDAMDERWAQRQRDKKQPKGQQSPATTEGSTTA